MKRSICFFHPPGGGESHHKAILLEVDTVYILAWIRNRKEKKGKQEHVCILTQMQTYLINKTQEESDLSLKICKRHSGKGTRTKYIHYRLHTKPKCVILCFLLYRESLSSWPSCPFSLPKSDLQRTYLKGNVLLSVCPCSSLVFTALPFLFSLLWVEGAHTQNCCLTPKATQEEWFKVPYTIACLERYLPPVNQ